MINKNEYIGLSQNSLDNEFTKACNHGNLEIVKYLLTSQEFKNHANIHVDDDVGFVSACNKGNINVVKYLLTSTELKEHANIHAWKDGGFKEACNQNHLNITQFLIFDMNIEKTESIQKYLKEFNNEQVENMFKLRELSEKLNNELICDKINKNKIKI